MRCALLAAALAVAVLTFSAPALAADLPSPLPTSTCSTLHHLTGKALWKHWIWHLRPGEYGRICRTVDGESGWNRWAHNGTYRGLVQFGAPWYAGRWHFDPYNPVLSIRVMVYMLRHPGATGGWSNWQGH